MFGAEEGGTMAAVAAVVVAVAAVVVAVAAVAVAVTGTVGGTMSW